MQIEIDEDEISIINMTMKKRDVRGIQIGDHALLVIKISEQLMLKILIQEMISQSAKDKNDYVIFYYYII